MKHQPDTPVHSLRQVLRDADARGDQQRHVKQHAIIDQRRIVVQHFEHIGLGPESFHAVLHPDENVKDRRQTQHERRKVSPAGLDPLL